MYSFLKFDNFLGCFQPDEPTTGYEYHFIKYFGLDDTDALRMRIGMSLNFIRDMRAWGSHEAATPKGKWIRLANYTEFELTRMCINAANKVVCQTVTASHWWCWMRRFPELC